MNKYKIEYKQLTIDPRWKVAKNEFIDLEPDNDYPIDEIFYFFMKIFYMPHLGIIT